MDLEQRFLLVLAEQHDQVLSLKQSQSVQQLLFTVDLFLFGSYCETLHQFLYACWLLEEGFVGDQHVSELLGHFLLSFSEIGGFADSDQLHVYNACRGVDCGTKSGLFEQVYCL